jgi:hypothetical protein
LRRERKLGRPKGKKNKPISIRQSLDGNVNDLQTITQKIHKRRGRPPKVRNEDSSFDMRDNSSIRKRGRPKGSKNKPKTSTS